MKNSEYYRGKLAAVLGGSEGIGLALAQDLVRAGANVLIASRSEEKLSKAQLSLEALRVSPAQLLGHRAFDITDSKATQSAIDQWVGAHGVPELLINCAGYAQPGYLDQLELKHFRAMMELNYFGTVHAAKSIVPYMIREKRGHIVNTSSMAGFLGLFGYTGYCASKFAVVGFSQALRHELLPYGVKVSVICPPNTRTPGLERENQDKPAEVLKLEEKAKVVSAEDVSRAVLAQLPKGRAMIHPTFDGELAYFLSRHFPWVIDQFTKRPTTI